MSEEQPPSAPGADGTPAWWAQPTGPPGYPPPGYPPPPGAWAPGGGPDPAAATGVPWPRLVAEPGSGYRPPNLIVWPIIAGVVIYVAYLIVVVIVAIAGSNNNSSTSGWLNDHDSALTVLNADETRLVQDGAGQAGGSVQFLSDLRQFRADVVADQSIPAPPGAARAPWREMLADYSRGSTELLKAIDNRDQALVKQAQQSLADGDSAAHHLNDALGVSAP